MAMSSQLRTELRKTQGVSQFQVLEVAWPTGTKRYAFGPGVAGAYQYDGKITELTPLVRAISDRAGAMQDVEYSVSVDDSDGFISGLMEGSSARLIRGSAVTLFLGSLGVVQANWLSIPNGIVDRPPTLTRPRLWNITVRPNDQALRSLFPKVAIESADWPFAPAASLAQYGPLLYGKHDSVNITGKGAVPLVQVDSTVGTQKYMLCWGRAKAIDRVYSDGVLQTSGFSVSYPVTNAGRICTVVTFTADQGTKAITADAQGYEAVGDGSGALITIPSDQMKHELANWIYGDYKSGAWLTTAPTDAATFAAMATAFAASNAAGSQRVFGKQRRGSDALNEWSQSWEAKLFWTLGFQIGGRVENLHQILTYSDDAFIRYDSFAGPFPIEPVRPDSEAYIDRVATQYLYDHAAGKYQRSLEVRDPSLTTEAPDSVALPWSGAYIS